MRYSCDDRSFEKCKACNKKHKMRFSFCCIEKCGKHSWCEGCKNSDGHLGRL